MCTDNFQGGCCIRLLEFELTDGLHQISTVRLDDCFRIFEFPIKTVCDLIDVVDRVSTVLVRLSCWGTFTTMIGKLTATQMIVCIILQCNGRLDKQMATMMCITDVDTCMTVCIRSCLCVGMHECVHMVLHVYVYVYICMSMCIYVC